MSDAAHPHQVEVLECKAYQIRVSQTKLEWMAFVMLPKQRPTLILAPVREAVLDKAYKWIEVQLQLAKDPL